MLLNVTKFTHLSVNLLPARKKLYTAARSEVFLDAQLLPQIGPEDLFKYLGLRFHPAGIHPPEETKVVAALQRVEMGSFKTLAEA